MDGIVPPGRYRWDGLRDDPLAGRRVGRRDTCVGRRDDCVGGRDVPPGAVVTSVRRWSSTCCVVELADRLEVLARSLGYSTGSVHFDDVASMFAPFDDGSASVPAQGRIPVTVLDEYPLPW